MIGSICICIYICICGTPPEQVQKIVNWELVKILEPENDFYEILYLYVHAACKQKNMFSPKKRLQLTFLSDY